MKRITSIFLSLVLLILPLLSTSCNKEETTDKTGATATTTNATETTTAATTTVETPQEPNRFEELGPKNFQNETFHILDANDHPDIHDNLPGTDLTGDLIYDALFERDAFMRDEYGINITYETITNAKTALTQYELSVKSGEKNYDMIISCILGGALGTTATNGYLTNLCDVPYISLDKNWWSPVLYDSLRLKDTMYYTTSDISPVMYQMPGCLFFNEVLLENLGHKTDDLFEMVIDGTWTLEELDKIIADQDVDLNNDGTIDGNDFYGMMIKDSDKEMTYQMFVGSGIELSTISDDGQSISVDLGSEKVLKIAETLESMVAPKPYDENIFKSGRAIVWVQKLEKVYTKLNDMEDDFLVMPIPKYDAAQENYRSMVSGWVDSWIAIPLDADLEKSGFVCEALAYYSYLNVRPQVYDVTYKFKTVRNEESSEVLDIIFNSLYFDYNNVYNWGDMLSSLHDAVWNDVPLSSALQGKQKVTNKMIEQFVNTWGS